MKEVASTATIVASIAIAVALVLMAPKGLDANLGPIVSSSSVDTR